MSEYADLIEKGQLLDVFGLNGVIGGWF